MRKKIDPPTESVNTSQSTSTTSAPRVSSRLPKWEPKEKEITRQVTDVGEDINRRKIEKLSNLVLPQDFEKLPETVGEGVWKVAATRVYSPSGAIEIPGTRFSDVCPSQPHVNRRIVESKIKAGVGGTPVVPAIQTKDGKIVLMDKHHLFVACMAMGKPVKLALLLEMNGDGSADWTGCTWKGFEKPKAGAKGFDPGPLEGEKPVEDTSGWKSVVPWRKDEPETDEGRVKGVMKTFKGGKGVDSQEVENQIFLACGDDPGLAEKLYETLTVGLVDVQVRPKPLKSTGGDWDAQNNTIYLDDDLAPLDMADMLIWEAYNAIHQSEFSVLQHKAYDERMDPAEYGRQKAKIEAQTELDYLEHLLARKGSTISAGGQKHLDEIDRKFRQKNEPVPYSQLSKEERKLKAWLVEEIFLETPHDANATLPDRNALASAELYAYEQVADHQNVKGIVGYIRDKLEEKGVTNYKDITEIIRGFPDCPTREGEIPLSWAGKFYDIVSRQFNGRFALGVPEFTDAQRSVADEEYVLTNGNWEASLRSVLDSI